VDQVGPKGLTCENVSADMSTMLIQFALASLLVIAIPGPDQALITRNAVLLGRRAGVRTMFGGATGLTLHAVGAALGVSAVLAASATAFTVVKLAGMAYLIYLGIRLLRSRASGDEGPAAPGRSAGHPYVEGLTSNVLNPKVALFFLTFLPQFVPANAAPLPTALALSAVFAVIYLAWFGGLLALVGLVARTLRRPRVQAWMERVSGIALLGFAARLAADA
jgi:threonine/homoserine/homoserine lactone efflux protein